MHRWSGSVAVVTGASSGIGSAVALDLVSNGLIVVGLARRVERIEALQQHIPADAPGTLHAFKCDVAKEEDVVAAFEWVREQFGGVDILINNAGVSGVTKLVAPGNTEQLRGMLETNVLGTAICTREAFQSMKQRQVAGHVVLVNSVVGHRIPIVPPLGSLNMYAPSKWAVTGMTEVLRQEFINEGTKIKVTVSIRKIYLNMLM